MGFKLCMAEKPSVAKDIATVIGANKSCHGYYEGNGYRVTWAVGHLVGLAEPESYSFVNQKDMWGDKREEAYEELPLIPKEFKLIVLEQTKDQFKIVKDLINSPETDEIINCGDMGPEGHILQWFIREKAGCKKKVRRFCATSMTEEAIRKAMENLRPEEDFERIIKGEFCKKKADWILGMSMSRAESIKYRTNITVGRVQSPTLFMIVKRYFLVKNFKVTDYFGMDVSLEEGFHVFWNKDIDNIFLENQKDIENRVIDKKAVEDKAGMIEQQKEGKVIEVLKQKKKNDRPQLFDITELQREANRKYGYTAAETLATAQALYETQKVLSYPRTDSRYITSDLQSYMPMRIKAIGSIRKYKGAVEELLKDGLNIDKKIVDDTKVTDHHALIPTEKIENFDVESMTPTPDEKKKGVTKESMQNILDLVLSRMIVSFSKPYIYEQTTIKVEFLNNLHFSASGKKPLEMGWRKVQDELCGKEEKENETDEEQLFPDVKEGQIVHVKQCDVVSKKTTPPKLHTEATLLTEMETAGKNTVDGLILKGKGIGTQATRAEIIKKLFDVGYVKTEKKGKTNYIVPTETGLKVVSILPKELMSAQMTADWEKRIAQIVDGTLTEQEFMERFETFIREKIMEVKNSENLVTFEKEKEVVGVCPWCGSQLYRYEEKKNRVTTVRHYCSNKECSFSLGTDNATIVAYTKRRLSEKDLKKLISQGQITVTCKSKMGTNYKGTFEIIKKEVNHKIYANLQYKTSSLKK